MKNVVRKIFEHSSDEEVHSEFIKFSRGLFKDRYLIYCKKQKNGYNIKTSSEFTNFFVRMGLQNVKGKVRVKGIIVSTSDIEKDCKFEISNVKKYMGIKQLVIDVEVDSKELLSIMDKHPRAFYALTFSSGMFDLKSKAKPPKSGKPGTKEEEPKADFCTVKTDSEEIVRDLLFDVPIFTEVTIKHQLEIKEIEIPKGISDPPKMRELAKRIGSIKRMVIVDGQQKESLAEFKA